MKTQIISRYHKDDGLIKFYVDGVYICEWSCEGEDGYELCYESFTKIYMAGFEDGIEQSKPKGNANDFTRND